MLAQVLSAAVLGVDAYLVRVEVDLANGLPSITVDDILRPYRPEGGAGRQAARADFSRAPARAIGLFSIDGGGAKCLARTSLRRRCGQG